MKKSDELKRQIADLTDEMQPLADKPSLSAVEQSRWDAVMGKNGQLAKLTAELETAIEAEDQRFRLRSARVSTHTPEPVFDSIGSGAYVPGSAGLPTVVSPTLRAFKGGGNKQQALTDAYTSMLFVRAVIQRDDRSREKLHSMFGEQWLAVHTENVPSDGGYLVPAPLQQSIIEYRQTAGVVRQLAANFPMGSDTLTVPKHISGHTVYYPGEAGAITPSDVEIGQISLTAKKRAVLSYLSSELNDDSAIGLMDYLVRDIASALALKEDAEGIQGDGTSTYGGVLGVYDAVVAATASVHTAATGNDTWPELTFGDMGGVMAKVPARFRVQNELSWLVNPAFKWQVMDRLTLAQGGSTATDMINGQPVMLFMGYPVFLSDEMPSTSAASTVCAIFGNFLAGVALGDRGGVRVATSEHVSFTSDQIAIRATTRYDINVHEAGDTSTAGSICGLATAS